MINRLLVTRTLERSWPARSLQNSVFFAATIYLQSTQVVDQVPGVVGLDNIRERRHGRAVQTSHENTIEVLIGDAALETRIVSCRGEIVRTDGLIFAVGEGRGRRSITVALLAMALPAFHLLEQVVATADTGNINRGLGRNLDRLAWFFGLPPLREGLDVSDEILPVFIAQRTPRRHIGGLDAAHNCVDQVRVERQGASGSRAALEGGVGEVARSRIDELSCVTIAIAIDAMAEHAIAQVESMSPLLGGTESVVARRIAGADARILGERSAGSKGKE